jgi:hypothetical protein
MNLSVSSQINTSIGTQVTGAVGYINANTDQLLKTGQVVCGLQFFANPTAVLSNMDSISPVVLKQDGTIQSRVSSINVSLTAQEAAAANLPLTIFNKAAAALTAA